MATLLKNLQWLQLVSQSGQAAQFVWSVFMVLEDTLLVVQAKDQPNTSLTRLEIQQTNTGWFQLLLSSGKAEKKCLNLLYVCIKALTLTSEAYFSALAKMGEQALNTLSSRSLGKTQDVCVFVSLNQCQLGRLWSKMSTEFLSVLSGCTRACLSFRQQMFQQMVSSGRCFLSSVIKHKIWLSETLGSLPM